MDIIALVIFTILQIMFIPLTIVGIILLIIKQLFVSKKLGVSSTATSVFTAKWAMVIFGMRKDMAAVKLNRVLSNNSIVGFWFVFFPSYIRYKISGKNNGYPSLSIPGEENISNMIMVRTMHIDNLINKSIDRVEQFVIMGAGLDTRCYGNIKNSDLRLFELDQDKTQRFKIEHLKRAGIDISNINYVEVDFSTEHWYEKLEMAGYDPNKKTIYLLEGVTLYLSENDVKNTLKEIKEHAATGSILIADFYAKRYVALKGSKITNEGFCFGLDFSSDYESVLKNFVENENFVLNNFFFMGHKTKKGAFMVVAEISI